MLAEASLPSRRRRVRSTERGLGGEGVGRAGAGCYKSNGDRGGGKFADDTGAGQGAPRGQRECSRRVPAPSGPGCDGSARYGVINMLRPFTKFSYTAVCVVRPQLVSR